MDHSEIVFGILGNAFHCPVMGEFEYLENALITVDTAGRIQAVLRPEEYQSSGIVQALEGQGRLQRLTASQYLIPGLIDLHNHAPQWPQMGKGLDLPLYDWLSNYTFPLEAKYQDLEFARQVYGDLVQSTLSSGTTSAVYFSSLHLEPSLVLAETCLDKGQRAFVGKVCMDDPDQCPDYYRQSAQQSLYETETFNHAVAGMKGNQGLVSSVVTPRFIPSCTEGLLKELGQFATANDCYVQTHCSESDWARDYSQQKYGETDISVYERTGLLGRKTLLAHSIFLTNQDILIIKDRGAGIAHCPLSNMCFANAAMTTRELLDQGVHCGLGSDVAASVTPSMLRSCFDAVTHSRVREEGTSTHRPAGERGESNTRISLVESFWMATAGGGQSLDQNIGLFKAGFGFDAVVVDAAVPDCDLTIWPGMDSPADILEKIISTTSRHNVTRVWVQGRQVIDKKTAG
ncbi:guanine deaminase [Parendozoicomonas haliclonae]|uniref:Guanine deaminase n=1 Tax=Parendozoicomonas haliclonae TaxID=1960125 RepID=A0A1X7AJQ8_9GAMM|nr:guanine deaminase [Parendozoicomonas haliclonae]SMA42060.1 Guanine deaminase [Parendozoicomonas haliclonae]